MEPLKVDPSLLVACPDLETADQLRAELEAKGFDLGKSLEKITGLQQQYIMCAVKDDCLIAAEKAADKKAPASCKQATDQLKAHTNGTNSTIK